MLLLTKAHSLFIFPFLFYLMSLFHSRMPSRILYYIQWLVMSPVHSQLFHVRTSWFLNHFHSSVGYLDFLYLSLPPTPMFMDTVFAKFLLIGLKFFKNWVLISIGHFLFAYISSASRLLDLSCQHGEVNWEQVAFRKPGALQEIVLR